VTDSEVSSDRPNKPASDSDPLNKTPSETSLRTNRHRLANFKGRFRVRLQLIGGAPRFDCGYRRDRGWPRRLLDCVEDAPHRRVSGQATTQREAKARPYIAPRLSLVVFCRSQTSATIWSRTISPTASTTDLTTDPRANAGAVRYRTRNGVTYKNKQIDSGRSGKDLGIRWAVQGPAGCGATGIRSGSTYHLRISRAVGTSGPIVSTAIVRTLAALQDQITARPRSLA